jgi:hypothetical protein
MHHVPRPATFMQVVDVLRDEQHVEGACVSRASASCAAFGAASSALARRAL